MDPILIDTDPGIDDALALLLAWGSREIVVEAVTTVAGNVSVEQATANLGRLLALRRPVPPPTTAIGAAKPLARPLVMATRYHGQDGLGDLGDWPPIDQSTSGSAAELIVDTARRLGRRLTLVALGPLTNLALALESDAGALRRVGRVVIMGGAVDVTGNVSPTAEFNIHVDPDAALQVFEAGLPIDLVSLDATRQARLARPALEAALASTPGPVATRIAAFTAPAFRRETEGQMTLHDPLATAVAVDATLVEWEPTRIAIEPHGATQRRSGTPNCRLARRVDTPRFLRMLLERLCPASL